MQPIDRHSFTPDMNAEYATLTGPQRAVIDEAIRLVRGPCDRVEFMAANSEYAVVAYRDHAHRLVVWLMNSSLHGATMAKGRVPLRMGDTREVDADIAALAATY
jgi:hypothetical protein